MSAYAIILNTPNANVQHLVQETWPNDHIILTDRIAFVAVRPATTTQEIADKLGMNQEGKMRGLVFDATYIAGWNDGQLSEWLRNVGDV